MNLPRQSNEMTTVSHPIPPVWNSESRILILGTMPSPKSREANFFYMHPQNRFWTVLPEVFGESFEHKNNGQKSDISAAIAERHEFLLRHNLAMWDVLASCEIAGAADSTIKNAVPNNFTEILENSKIHQIICTGKTAWNLWQKHCAALYETKYKLTIRCLPSTSPANAQWSKEKLTAEYKIILNLLQK